MRRLKANNSFLSFLVLIIAVVLICGVSIKSAIAYFTTYCMAEGGLPIEFGTWTTITEEPDVVSGKKVVSISNDAKSKQAIYVRVTAFAGAKFNPLSYDGGDAWTSAADTVTGITWWYYNGVLQPGENTDSTKLTIESPQLLTTEGFNEGDKIEIAVVYESMPVQVDANGNQLTALQADWSKVVQKAE